MSSSPRKPRSKSGTLMRPLGGIQQFAYGTPPRTVAPTRNDPALQVNQMSHPRLASPVNPQIKEAEREYKILRESFKSSQQNLKDLAKSQKKLESRELKLKSSISDLEKLIAELRYDVKTKTEVLEALKKTLDSKTKEHEDVLSKKKLECHELQSSLNASRAETSAKQRKMNEIIRDYEKKVTSMKEEHERQIRELREERDTKIAEKDNRLDLLKKRMADTIGRNSSERQHQLDDLKKDLIKASHEAKELHRQLHFVQHDPPKCKNCPRLESQLEEKTLQVRLKEKSINDLQGIAKTMQLQLHQQHRALVRRQELSYEKQKAFCLRAGIKPPARPAVSGPLPKIFEPGSNLVTNQMRNYSAGSKPRKDAILNKWEEKEKRF